MLTVESIDIEEYLQSRDIPYSPAGSKNVSRNSIGISCPFCGDNSSHLGIKLDTKQWNCWICGAGRKKHFLSLVVKLENCSYRQAEELLKPFAHSDMSLFSRAADVPINVPYERFNLPTECKNNLMDAHRKYLESRGFDPDYIFDKYKLKCVGPVSRRWKLSLIAPVYFRHRIVSFLAADITRKRKNKYDNCSLEESVIPINQTLYNIDNASNSVIVVEGITDVWNIGDGAVALYTKHASRQQLKILSAFDRVFIMLDPDAFTNDGLNKLSSADQLAQDLSAFTETVIIEMDHGDPAELSGADVSSLRREIFGS